MKFNIVFDNTGDSIPFIAVNTDLVLYIIENFNRLGINRFKSINNPSADIVNQCRSLKIIIDQLNQYFEYLFDRKFVDNDSNEYLAQYVLNRLHFLWASSHTLMYDIDQARIKRRPLAEKIHDQYPDSERFPLLPDVLNKLGFLSQYREINQLIHRIESGFNFLKFKVDTDQWIELENPFPKSLLTNDICNFNLTFNHLGRTLSDKWLNWDLDLNHDDENSYNQILGFVDVRLCQPQHHQPCREYIDWCQMHHREPIGEFLNLGNVPKLFDNLTTYRKMFIENLSRNNSFSIQI